MFNSVFRGDDKELATTLINQGIDSRLLAMTSSEFTLRNDGLYCEFSPHDLGVFLVRLWDFAWQGDGQPDYSALSLFEDMIATINPDWEDVELVENEDGSLVLHALLWDVGDYGVMADPFSLIE